MLFGHNKITCTDRGMWNGIPPACLGRYYRRSGNFTCIFFAEEIFMCLIFDARRKIERALYTFRAFYFATNATGEKK